MVAALDLDPESNMDSGTYQEDLEHHNLSAVGPGSEFTAIICIRLTPAQLRPALDTPIIILPTFSHGHLAVALILCIAFGSVLQL